jgi:hypothetical protein
MAVAKQSQKRVLEPDRAKDDQLKDGINLW